MKFLKINLLIISIILSVSTFAFGQKQSSESNKNQSKSKQTQISEDWKLVKLKKFSFKLPESMEDKKARGIDTAVWRFENDEITLYIDSGRDISDFQDAKFSYQVKEEQVTIDGKKVKFLSWNSNKDISNSYVLNDDGSKVPHTIYEKPFAIGVYFQKGQQKHYGTNFLVKTKTIESQETAKKILKSIKFK